MKKSRYPKKKANLQKKAFKKKLRKNEVFLRKNHPAKLKKVKKRGETYKTFGHPSKVSKEKKGNVKKSCERVLSLYFKK